MIFIFLSLVLIGMFYYFSVSIIADNFKDKIYTSQINSLTHISNSVDLTFYNISRSMRQASQNQSIISAMITPNPNNYQRNLNIIDQLKNVCKSNNLIKNAYLVTTTDNIIFSSDGAIYRIEDFYDKDMIRNEMGVTFADNSDIVTDIKIINGRIILRQYFFPLRLKQVGFIIFEIDNSQFYRAVLGNENNIYVLDEKNNPVFPQQLDYSKINIKKEYIESKLGNYSVRNITGGETLYFFANSDRTHWKYIHAVNSIGLDLNFYEITKAVLPFLLLFLTLSIVLSLYMTMKIYQPIGHLHASVSETGKGSLTDDKHAKNELDFLGLRYAEAIVNNDKLNKSIENIAPAVLERLFFNLLHGRQMSHGSIQDTLDSVGSQFSLTGRYIVLIASIRQANGKEIPEEEMSSCIVQINNMVRTALADKAEFCLVRTGNHPVTFVLEFANDISGVQIKHKIISLCSSIAAKARTLRYTVTFGRGNLCGHLDDLKYSYLEAQENLEYNISLSDKTAENGLGATEVNNNGYDNNYFTTRIKRILEHIDEGEYLQTVELMKRLITEISSAITDLSIARRSFQMIVDSLIEKMVDLRISASSAEQILGARKEMENKLEHFSSTKQMDEYIVMLCVQAIELMEAHNKKPRHKYILAAREYLDKNYAKSELSLQTTADSIGVSPPYLSRLFSEILNLHFIDYLNEVRVAKAEKLLRETDLSVKDISNKCGFNSLQNFFRVFKKFKGISPGCYRQEHKISW